MSPGNTLISLSEAVSEIKQACDECSDTYPFFFLVGAGISHPPVPLAGQITEACRKKAISLERDKEPQQTDSMNQYSHWFDRAYPQPVQRKKYLKSIIENKPISRANFRLAHLLLGEQREGTQGCRPVTNLVVTANFDDFLSKALNIFGKSHIICDHPETTMRVDLHNKDELFLIHVHGTYNFYDLKNLAGEIKEAATHSNSSSCTMAGLLEAILRDRSPLVVGYSGWENDVMMQAIVKRLNSTPPPYNLYWFCHQRAAVESLPAALRNNPYVRFVVPEESKRSLSAHDDEEMLPEKIERVKSKPPRLEAFRVFEALNRAFRFPSPYITLEPLKFLENQLNTKFPQEDLSADGADIYSLANVVQKIRDADIWLVKKLEQLDQYKANVEKIREAIRSSQYREALVAGQALNVANVPQENHKELFDLFVEICSGLQGQLEDLLKASELAIQIGKAIQKPSIKITANVVCMLVVKGLTLGQLGRSEDEIAVYNEVLDSVGAASEPELRECVANALVGKGAALGQLGRSEDEIAVYDEVLNRFDAATEPELRVCVAKALINKGITLHQLGRRDDEIAVYDELIIRYDSAPEQEVRKYVALALVNKGITLGKQDQPQEAIIVYNNMLTRFDAVIDPVIRNYVARALINKGVMLGRLNRPEEAVTVYDTVLNRFGVATEPELRESVVKALVNKGIRLGNLNRHEEFIAVCDEVLNRFGTATEPMMRIRVAQALVNKGATLSHLRRRDEAIAVFDEVQNRFSTATEPALRELVEQVIQLRKSIQ